MPEGVRSAYLATVELAARSALERRARRMLAAVLVATAGRDRVACGTTVRELAAIAKLDRKDAKKAISELQVAGLVAFETAGETLHVALCTPPSSDLAANGRAEEPVVTAVPTIGATAPGSPRRAGALPQAGRFGRARRLSWGVADQALSSITNFALSILVAHAVGVHGFGVFGLTFTTYTFALGTTRSLCSEPLAVRHAARGDGVWRTGARASTGTVLALSIPIGTACVIAGALANSTTGDAFVALGVCLPGLMLQDAWRMAFFANGRGGSAFANDAIWAAVQFPAMLFAIGAGVHDTAPLILCWGGAATAAAAVGIMQARVVPQPDRAGQWFRNHRDIAPRFFVEFLARYGTNAGCIYVTAVAAGVAAAGAFRAGQVLLGPINLFNIGLTGVAVYEAVRLRDQPRRMQRMALLVGAGIAAVSIVWGALMYALPESVGHALLSHSWESGHSVLVPLTIAAAASGILTGATVGLRALAAAKRSMRVRLITAAITIVASTVGAISAGATGAAAGLALGLSVGALMWVAELNSATREAARTVAHTPVAGGAQV